MNVISVLHIICTPSGSQSFHIFVDSVYPIIRRFDLSLNFSAVLFGIHLSSIRGRLRSIHILRR